MNDCSVRNQRNDFRNAEFRRLLENQIHVFPFGNRLRERDRAAKWFCFRGKQFFQMDTFPFSMAVISAVICEPLPIKDDHPRSDA